MHFDIEATSKRDVLPRVLHHGLCFLRSYQPYQINTLFQYMRLIQSEELLVIRANRKQARKSFQEGRPDSIIFVMFPLLYLFREFSNVYTMYRQRHIRAGYIPDCERLFRPEFINMQERWNFLNRAALSDKLRF